MSSKLIGEWNSFDGLSARDVHDLLKLRQDVFMLEQDCLFPEIDGKDPETEHFFLRDTETGALAGAIRLFSASDKEIRIGRVVVAQTHRGLGLGRDLMLAGMDRARHLAPAADIHLSAQAHLEKFYKSLGFSTISEVYLEDDIPHIDMVATPGGSQ
ncbi:GNAT family N-acetyltransferase [Roseibium sp.]|uniref:GNAT family N-acetyltransferase n=1 Tax=Roseibium sp. TaxID=1936156 RepID=UPI003B523920